MLTFWWKVSSAGDNDYLRFYIDGVEQTGSISGEVDWQLKTHTIAAGSHTLKWAYTKDISLSSGSDAGWVDQVTYTLTLPIGEAGDNTALTWTAGGDANWYGQSVVRHDGVDAAQSGMITNSQSTWMQTTVTGPGVLTFWWKVSSEPNYDWFEFRLNDVLQQRISGEAGWHYVQVPLPAGPQTARWSYNKDNNYSVGLDAAWLDQVQVKRPAIGSLDQIILETNDNKFIIAPCGDLHLCVFTTADAHLGLIRVVLKSIQSEISMENKDLSTL